METARHPEQEAPLASEHPLASTCPRCRQPALFRSRFRSRLEALVAAATPLRPYRCRDCMYRSWRARPPGREAEASARWRDTASLGIGAIREWIARTARQRRVDRAAALRLAGLTAAVLVLAGLLVVGDRWLKGRLGTGGRDATNATAAAVVPAAAPQLRASPAPARSVTAAKRSRSKARPAAASASASGNAVSSPGSVGVRVAERGAPRAGKVAFSWDGARWGMSVRDAANALPDHALAVRHGRPGEHAIARTATRLGSRAYVAELRFDRVAGLDEIHLTPSAELEDVDAAFEDAVAALTARYGAPTHRGEDTSPAGSSHRTVAWSASGAQISVHAWKTAIREAKVLRFDVKSGAVTPAPTGLDVTFAPTAPR